MISCCDWRSWTKPGYIVMTRRQCNNQCIDGIAAHHAPNNSVWKNPLEKFSPWFFGIIDCLPSGHTYYQRGELLIPSGVIEGHFDGKTRREFHQRCLVLARQCPGTPYQKHKRSQPGNRHKGILRNFYRIWQKYRRFFQLNVHSRNSVKYNHFNVCPIWKVSEFCKDDAAEVRGVLISP